MSKMKLYDRMVALEGLDEETPPNPQGNEPAEVPAGGDTPESAGNAEEQTPADAPAADAADATTDAGEASGDDLSGMDDAGEDGDGNDLAGEEDDGEIVFIDEKELNVDMVAGIEAIDARERAESEKVTADVSDAVKEVAEVVAAMEAFAGLQGAQVGAKTRAYLTRHLSMESREKPAVLVMEDFKGLINSLMNKLLEFIRKAIAWVREVVRRWKSRALYNRTRTKQLSQQLIDIKVARGEKAGNNTPEDQARAEVKSGPMGLLQNRFLRIKGKQPESYAAELHEVATLLKTVDEFKAIFNKDMVKRTEGLFEAIEAGNDAVLKSPFTLKTVYNVLSENATAIKPSSIKHQGYGSEEDGKLIAFSVSDLLGDVSFYNVFSGEGTSDMTLIPTLQAFKSWKFYRVTDDQQVSAGLLPLRMLTKEEILETSKALSVMYKALEDCEKYLDGLEDIQKGLEAVAVRAGKTLAANQDPEFFSGTGENGWRGQVLTALTGALAVASIGMNDSVWQLYQYGWAVSSSWNLYLQAMLDTEQGV